MISDDSASYKERMIVKKKLLSCYSSVIPYTTFVKGLFLNRFSDSFLFV